MVDRSRREAIKTIVKGAAYVSPAIYTVAAPARLVAQGSSGMDMWMICDWFPIICMWFESAPAAQPPGIPILPGQDPNFPATPGRPAPGNRPPWELH